MSFAAQEGNFFWSNGHAWGTFSQKKAGNGYEVELSVKGGEVSLNELGLTGVGMATFEPILRLKAGETYKGSIGGQNIGKGPS